MTDHVVEAIEWKRVASRRRPAHCADRRRERGRAAHRRRARRPGRRCCSSPATRPPSTSSATARSRCCATARSSSAGRTIRRSRPTAIDELLRYDAPVQFSRRVTTADVEIDGRTIAAGTFVFVVLGSANRDPAHWGDDADTARPHPCRRRAAPRVRQRHPPLPRRRAGASRGPHRARHARPAVPGDGAGNRPSRNGTAGSRCAGSTSSRSAWARSGALAAAAGNTCARKEVARAMPAVTVDNPLVLPRIARPDVTSSVTRPVDPVVPSTHTIEGAGFEVWRPFPGGLSPLRHRPLPPARPARPRRVRAERGEGRALAPAPRVRDRHLRARRRDLAPRLQRRRRHHRRGRHAVDDRRWRHPARRGAERAVVP